ncbi:linoleate 13S-lipoxygenase 2-1, chloroplastic-like isoform X1 [Vicia villosa]|uniref:linoleate 13S-lipoxygenase 2-1, chloroplastic-like isoform X1 n=1 Tax=Vicia villosa TaxID=3911 RepID=UPI00273A7D26|nr:linoleate 13S-lipoxygenase 2-1, chloroplastic-like isoform X1 [Vicia villosa]
MDCVTQCMKAVMGSSGDDDDTNSKSQNLIKVKAIVTLKHSDDGLLRNLVDGGIQQVEELVGKTLVLELVSNELDQAAYYLEKEMVKGSAQFTEEKEGDEKYEAEFKLSKDFGKVGAILVENEQHKEVFLKSIVLHGFSDGPINFTCNSWIQPKHDSPAKRAFFTDKSFLPSQTPKGLRRLRKEELVLLRGNGEGERKESDRIYDYDVYNDLGDPDISIELKRPVLGGTKQYPYPRRCRTGRKHSDADPLYEKRSTFNFYVPRDESFSEIKQTQFNTSSISSGLTAVIQSLDTILTDPNLGFSSFEDIEEVYKEGFHLPPLKSNDLTFLQRVIPKLISVANDSQNLLRFDAPEPLKRDRFFWFSDVEFARETLAGANPYSIQLVKEWPLKSKLDPKVYGPAESAITREIIESQIITYSTFEEAIKEKKLFMLDYHDLYLPYVSKVREIEGTTLYGSRTLFFLTNQGILKPLAIELTRPIIDGKPQWKQVFTPASHSTNLWLWRLAKAHVLAHDSGHHELISHWLRTHCVVEPIIIATYRQLSSMHPIYRLLHPHLRYTMEINKVAREVLINANGILEISFFPKKYTMELSSVAYDKLWQFDLQALPNDLINRGMAVEDPNAEHGLKLAIEDYPFANDGLLIWDAIKQWVTDYVNHYYPSPKIVESDEELQAWWTEIKTVGHGDKSEEPWWPKLKTQKDLIDIITTIAWVASAHHSAVNFTQYPYGGYFPNRPTIARNKMPTEDPTKEEWEKFINKPDQALLECFPSQIQATIFMVILHILSAHSPDEEYIGEKIEPSWGENPTIKAAFEKFHRRLKEIEGIIDSRNGNKSLKNRNGAGIMPYESLKPFSGPGITGKGVPYSISI